MEDFKKYKDIFEKLNTERKLLFILQLLIRQRNLYLDFCDRVNWGQKEKCMDIFKQFYHCILEKKNFELEEAIEEINPENFQWDEGVNDIVGYIITIIDNMKAFGKQINEREEIDIYFTRCNFDLIEAYIFDNTDIEYDNIEAIKNYPDMKSEIEKGIGDLVMIAKGNGLNGEILDMNDILFKINY